MNFKIKVGPEDASRVLDWIKNRGGVAIWKSIDLSCPGQETFTPAMSVAGSPTSKPHWRYANEPAEIVTDPAMIGVIKYKEVKRFHVAIRMGRQGMSYKCTDASSARVRREVDKAGDGAIYEFDYSTQDAVILKPESEVSLKEYKDGQ